MSDLKKKRLLSPLNYVLACLFVVMTGSLTFIEVFNLDPDMVKMSGNNNIQEGIISAITEDGIEIVNRDSNVRRSYRPIIPIRENKNPALEFAFLARAQATGQPVCFLSASTEKSGYLQVAYNFHQCGKVSVGTNIVMPGTHRYISNLRGYGVTTLIGYKDGTRAGDKGKSQLEKNKFLLLYLDNKTVEVERASSYGFPNGRYSAEDIGHRFCMSQHEIVEVKFSKHLKPIGIWENRDHEVFLWSCLSANEPGYKPYIQFFE